MKERIFLDMKNYNFIKTFILALVLMLSYANISYAAYDKIYTLRLEGIITSATHNMLENNLRKAEVDNIPLLIYLDTPGGVLEETSKIVQLLLNAKTPVIVYVSPDGAKAASAGAFITLAAEYVIMDYSTHIGAAHPVNHDGKDIEGVMGDKVLNDTVALMKNIAEKRNRNINAAVNMVTQSKSYTAKEAMELNLINNVASPKEITDILSKQYGVNKNPVIVELDPTFLQSFYYTIADPNFLVVILFIGIILILLEITMPGTFIFASLGIAALVIFAFGVNLLPINLFGLALVGLGMALLIAEIFLPSFGALTVSGIISLVFGLKMLFESKESIGVSVSYWFIGTIILITIIIAFLIGRLIVKDFSRKPIVGKEALIQEEAKVIEWHEGQGRVTMHGEIWNAVSDDELLKDDIVLIEKLTNLTLHVKKK